MCDPGVYMISSAGRGICCRHSESRPSVFDSHLLSASRFMAAKQRLSPWRYTRESFRIRFPEQSEAEPRRSLINWFLITVWIIWSLYLTLTIKYGSKDRHFKPHEFLSKLINYDLLGQHVRHAALKLCFIMRNPLRLNLVCTTWMEKRVPLTPIWQANPHIHYPLRNSFSPSLKYSRSKYPLGQGAERGASEPGITGSLST